MCAIFIYICEQVQHVHASWILHSVKERESLFVSALCKGWHVAAALQEKPRRNSDGTVSQRIPISSLCPKGVISFSSLLIAINFPSPPTSHQPACPVHRYQRTGLNTFSLPAAQLWMFSHMYTASPMKNVSNRW